MYALTNIILHTSQQQLTHHAVLIEGDRIVDLLPESSLSSDCPRVDGMGTQAAPGFIDLQLNGCGGVMFNDEITEQTLETMHETNLRSGTTSFLPTLITTSDADMIEAMQVVAAYRKRSPDNVLGLHLEGPYLNPKRKGIHNERFIRRPDPDMLQRLVRAGRDPVKLVTLAPEVVDATDIRRLAEAGIVVSAGHTDATFEQALVGFDAGIRMVTHVFNAMSPWLSRSPGMVGALFSRPDIYGGIIVDGEHVHFASVRLAKALKHEKLLLVTDATPPVGTQMTRFWIGGQEVFYRDGRCVSADGTLGGSALTMIQAIANCVKEVGMALPEALRMASTYPAHLLGLDQDLGRIAPGYRANLVLFDADFRVVGVVDRGHYKNFAL